jgi:hypothetical protein
MEMRTYHSVRISAVVSGRLQRAHQRDTYTGRIASRPGAFSPLDILDLFFTDHQSIPPSQRTARASGTDRAVQAEPGGDRIDQAQFTLSRLPLIAEKEKAILQNKYKHIEHTSGP